MVAVALLGDVTIDLTRTRSTPGVVAIDAYAVGRDVDILVDADDNVETTGRVDLTLAKPDIPAARAIRVHGRAVLGRVTVRR